MSAPPRSLPLVAAVLGVAIVVVQIRVIAGGQTWDDVRYHTEVAPPRLAAAIAVARGDLPAWWDGSGLGVTLAGEPEHAALYPANWLAATPRALDLAILAHLMWAALGVAVWARRRASYRSALVAGLLVATTGIVMSAALRGALPGLAQVPWLGAAVGWLAAAATRRDRARAACAIGALVAAIALAGQLALVVDAVAIALALGLGRGTARWLIAAVAAGLAIGALQWLPALVQLPGEAGAQVVGLPLGRLIELLVPGAFGGGATDHAVPAIAGAAPWAPSLFFGAPLLALPAVRPPSRRVLGVICGLTGAALVAGRGGWPAWTGAPELHLAVLAVVLAVAAADGLDGLVLGQRRAVFTLGLGAGFAAVALAALAMLRAQHPELAVPIDRALLDGALGVVCMAGALALAWRAPGRHVAVLFALLIAPSVGAAPSIAPAVDRAVVTEPPPWAQLAARSAPPVRAYRPAVMTERLATLDERGPLVGHARPGARGATPGDRADVDDAIATFTGESAWRWGIAGARSEDPARAALHDRVWLAAAREGGALLDRYGVALAIVPATLIGPRKFHALGRRGSWALVELPVAPAASVMRGWRWARDPGDALALLFPAAGGTGLLRGTAVLAGAGPEGPTSLAPMPCAIDAWRDGDIALTCGSDAPAYAVVSSSAAPGWQVTVDGAPTAWLAADILRRAVALPPGTHRVHWHYELPGLGTGALIGAAGLAVLLGLFALGINARRTSVAGVSTGERV